MLILIPTYGRVESQTTYERLPPKLKEMVTLVVSEQEEPLHKKKGRPVLSCPIQGRGMAAVRAWMMDWCYENGHNKVLFLDDDLTLQKRGTDLRVVGEATEEQHLEMVDWVDRKLNKFYHCAFTERNVAWDDSSEYQIATKGIQVVGYNVKKVIERTECRFDKGVPEWFFMEDYHMTLQLFRAGQPNIVSRVYRVNFGNSNAPGGCSTFRTASSMEEASKLLERLHPGFVKAVEKETKMSFGGGKRWNVRVQWRKAYESSKKKPTG